MKQAALLSGPADLIRGELEQVEAILEEACLSEVELLQEAARNIVTAGGKRLRPQLALLSAAAAGARPGRAVAVAAACELIHTATLVHDDIVDESDSRRGRMSSRYFYGNSASVLMGDYLVVRAFRLVSCEPDRRHWTFMADTIARMCEGEVLQLCERGNTELGVEVYERIIECKTALLMSLCCRLGAFLGEVPEIQADALASFGYHVGMAFQIQDDILDLTGDEATLGKPIGGDIREGKVTLPILYALQDAAPEDRDVLLRFYQSAATLGREEIHCAVRITERAGGVDRARGRARQFLQQARRELERIPESPARMQLAALSDQIVDRRR